MLHKNLDKEIVNTTNIDEMTTFFTDKSPTPLDLFYRALNTFLLPYEISADDCPIFIDILL